MNRTFQQAWLAAALFALAPIARADDTSAPSVTFTKNIAPIFQARCENCHRPNQLAPMSLTSYAEARPWAKSIKKAVADKKMPPWHADPSVGHFTNDISLTADEISAITQWVDQGAPEGNPSDLPPAKVWNDSEWKAGMPDISAFPKVAFEVPVTARNEDVYQCIVIPTNLEQDTWVRGFEYKIDKPSVVHHVIGFVDVDGKMAALDAKTPEPGYPCGMGGGTQSAGLDAMLGGWAPGMPPNIYDKGVGKLLPKGSNIVLQMHYHNETGTSVKDASGLGIYFARDTIQQRSRIMPIAQFKLFLPAGDANAETEARWNVPKDIEILTLMPHMHVIGKDMTMSAITADGNTETLLRVPRYDFNWQTVYHLKERKRLAKGTVIHAIGHHDNSADNPNNPSKPPIDVKWGEATTEEMFIGWVGYVYADERLNIQPQPPVTAPVGQSAPAKTEQISAAN